LIAKGENAEKMNFLQTIVLAGKLKTACHKALGVVKDMFTNKCPE